MNQSAWRRGIIERCKTVASITIYIAFLSKKISVFFGTFEKKRLYSDTQ